MFYLPATDVRHTKRGRVQKHADKHAFWNDFRSIQVFSEDSPTCARVNRRPFMVFSLIYHMNPSISIDNRLG